MTPANHGATVAERPTAAQQDRLDFYAHAGTITSPGQYASLLEQLPDDVAPLAGIVPGLSVHEYMASGYGLTIPPERQSESHIRRLERMLERVLSLDNGPLTEARPPEKRLVGVCNHFAVMLVGMLRAKGAPARARWGFGSYFNPPVFEDHVLGEYWNADEDRWVRVDAQIDGVFRKALQIDFDTLDVPHDRFVIAGDAWAQCRSGRADASHYGIFKGDLRGLWFIACNLIKDLAALNKMETLPWDFWGAMPNPGTTLSEEQLEFFDRLAELTRKPDASFAEIRRIYESSPVPPIVYNSVLQRTEAI